MRFDLPKAAAELACLDPVRTSHPGGVLGDDVNQQHRPVQHLVVLEVAEQGYRHVFGLGGQKDGDPRNAGFRRLVAGDEKGGERHGLARQLDPHQPASRAPGGQDRKYRDPDHQREPAAARDLQGIGPE